MGNTKQNDIKKRILEIKKIMFLKSKTNTEPIDEIAELIRLQKVYNDIITKELVIFNNKYFCTFKGIVWN